LGLRTSAEWQGRNRAIWRCGPGMRELWSILRIILFSAC
jgi:hypothetical protein